MCFIMVSGVPHSEHLYDNIADLVNTKKSPILIVDEGYERNQTSKPKGKRPFDLLQHTYPPLRREGFVDLDVDHTPQRPTP